MEPHVVAAPQFGVNDTAATVVAWHVAEGDDVAKGMVLCELETAKATFEIEASAAGMVLPLVETGAEVSVSQPLALIGTERAALEQRRASLTARASSDQPAVVTDKARRLGEELGIDLALVPVAGPIMRESDVLAHARSLEPDPFALTPLAGRLDPAFRQAIADDPAFAALPSADKVARYRAAGAIIGEGVELGAGVVILADAIELQDEVEIGADTRISAETFAMGRMSVLGGRCKINCRHVRIGDCFFSASEIIVGGADRFTDTDRLIIGDQCLVSARCFLDSGHGIRLGNQVALSPFVKLYTHQHWQNVLEGYHANFGSIVIEDGAYVTGDCLVTPGVRIGAGATILANSTVAGNVEPYTIVSGNPAKRIGKVERPVPLERKERIVTRLLGQMSEALAGALPEGAVTYMRTLDPQAVAGASVVLTFDSAGQESALAEGLVVFDLGHYRVHGRQTPISDEVRNFLRRRGIRFAPIHWRYRG